MNFKLFQKQISKAEDKGDDEDLPKFDPQVEAQELGDQLLFFAGKQHGAERIGEAQSVDESKNQREEVNQPQARGEDFGR